MKTIITLILLTTPLSVFAIGGSFSGGRGSFGRSSFRSSYSRPTVPRTTVNKTVNVTHVTQVTHITQSHSEPSFFLGLFSPTNLMLGWLIWGNHKTQQKLDNLTASTTQK